MHHYSGQSIGVKQELAGSCLVKLKWPDLAARRTVRAREAGTVDDTRALTAGSAHTSHRRSLRDRWRDTRNREDLPL